MWVFSRLTLYELLQDRKMKSYLNKFCFFLFVFTNHNSFALPVLQIGKVLTTFYGSSYHTTEKDGIVDPQSDLMTEDQPIPLTYIIKGFCDGRVPYPYSGKVCREDFTGTDNRHRASQQLPRPGRDLHVASTPSDKSTPPLSDGVDATWRPLLWTL